MKKSRMGCALLLLGACGPDLYVQGLHGEPGEPGERGEQGAMGVAGATGLRGPQGVGNEGDKGDRGQDGADGLQGLQGLQGERGLQGLRGPQGIAGPPAASLAWVDSAGSLIADTFPASSPFATTGYVRSSAVWWLFSAEDGTLGPLWSTTGVYDTADCGDSVFITRPHAPMNSAWQVQVGSRHVYAREGRTFPEPLEQCYTIDDADQCVEIACPSEGAATKAIVIERPQIEAVPPFRLRFELPEKA